MERRFVSFFSFFKSFSFLKVCVFDPRSPPEEKDQCSTNEDCKGRGERTVCKEEQKKGTRKCVKPEKCKSTCEKDEICDENEQCRAPIKCNSNVDCDVDEGEICKDDPTTGLKICVSPVDLIKVFFFSFSCLLP